MNHIQKIRNLLERTDKAQLVWLVFFSILISIVETIGISAIMPFIDIVINFNNIHSNSYYSFTYHFFNFKSDISFAIAFGFTLVGFYVFRGGINLIYNYFMASFSLNLYAKITKKLFKTYLAMPFNVFTIKNSSYLTKVVISEASLMSGVIRSVLVMISEVFIVIFLYSLMFFMSWKITLIFTIILMIKLVFLSTIISKRIKLAGISREKVQSEMYEMMNRLFGNFKQTKLQDFDRQNNTIDQFASIADKYAKANTTRIFLDSFPRIFLETGGFSLVILLIIYFLFDSGLNVAQIIPTVSLFVLALFRLLPSANRIISGFNTLVFYHKSIDAVYDSFNLLQEKIDDKILKFDNKIELNDICFDYKEKSILKNIGLIIKKGDKVALVGESGSGKSTLADIIIGLNIPNSGELKIDDMLVDYSNLQSWRSQIGYIPQNIYLFDGTISENICFGRELDQDLLEKVLKQANIYKDLLKKQGTNTLVGEGGIQLSGGQKQRIAIARALYGRPEILVLDEATSALDEDTKKSIMDEIFQICKDKTLIIITHQLNTIHYCNKIFTLHDGKLIDSKL